MSVIIGCTEKNYSAYIEGVDGIVATGATIAEIKKNMTEAIDTFIDACHGAGCEVPEDLEGDFDLVFKMDVQSFLKLYSGIFSKSGLERLTGINQKQLWHYANGKSVPRRTQVLKIEDALHRLGNELLSVQL